MFSPDIYLIRKIPFLEVIRQNFDVNIVNKDYIVQQFDCMMFRLIRNICGKKNYIEQIVFIDCNGARSKTNEIENAVVNGIKINGKRYVVTERSASMSRNAILGFISEDIAEEIDKAITMDIQIEKTVLSKYCAYRGLMFSSCHCLEDYLPKIIVVPDYEKTLENQMIKYLVDKEIEYVDTTTGENKIWKTSDIVTGYKDVNINVFDGFGICHPNISKKISSIIGIEGRVSTFMIRAPFIKGLISEIDYTSYFKDKGIDFIEDIWGKWHSVDEEMIILTASQYKGYKYFKNTNTFSDWDYYWGKFKKYHHCLGIAKWNFTKEEEPVYTRANYQILQDLDLCFEDFNTLAEKSMDWADKIVNGDEIYSYCFLGLANDNPKPLNSYAKAILKNKEMLHEQCVRDFLKRQVKKYIDKMKCGKLYIKSCYKFLIPDIIMLLEWIGCREEPTGILQYDEFWSPGYFGEHAIERNPHICKSEHLVLNAIQNEEIEKYCGHLENVCMLNGYSLSAQRLNGADFDGDLVLVVDEPMFISGIDKNCPIVINIDEKKTALEEPVNREHIAKLIGRTLISLIGECSNAATCYHNKMARSEDVKDKYKKYVDILSIVNSFAIDFAKTGYVMNIPYHIAKYSKPYPYFMRYISEYYEGVFQSMEKGKGNYKFSKSNSNMNKLAFMIEKFHNKEIKWKRNTSFDYSIMIDESIPIDKNKLNRIEEIYKDFNKQIRYLTVFEKKLHNYDLYKDELKAWDKDSAINYRVNWQSVYDKYKNECESVCDSRKELANLATIVCYENHKSGSKKFLWAVASAGILENLKQQEIYLPIKDENGEYEYLGKKYSKYLYKGE